MSIPNRKNDIIDFMDTVTIKNDNGMINNLIKTKLMYKFNDIEKDDELLTSYDDIREDDVLKIVPLDESYMMICKVNDIIFNVDIDTKIQSIDMIYVQVLRNRYSKKKQYCKSYKINPHKFHLFKSRYNADQYYNSIIQLSKQMHLW